MVIHGKYTDTLQIGMKVLHIQYYPENKLCNKLSPLDYSYFSYNIFSYQFSF